MSKKRVNEVLAENLAYFMHIRGLKQKALAAKSGVAQTTISLYLNPENRQPGKTGKIPSGKLSEVEALAEALGVGFWEMVVPFTPAQRSLFKEFEKLMNRAELVAPELPALESPRKFAA